MNGQPEVAVARLQPDEEALGRLFCLPVQAVQDRLAPVDHELRSLGVDVIKLFWRKSRFPQNFQPRYFGKLSYATGLIFILANGQKLKRQSIVGVIILFGKIGTAGF